MSLLSTIKTSLDEFFLLLSSKQPSGVCPGEGDDGGGSCIETVRTGGDDDDEEPELPVSYMPYYVVEGVKVFQGMDELRDYQSAMAVSGSAFKESVDAIDPNYFNKDVQGTVHKFCK
ncbi:hypothetical protein K1719_030761 [Acacia pycnantha]|nr:hypothetical protein K1719_030761 [Acacia pycnantha]